MGSALDIKPGRLAAMVMAGGVNTIPLYEGYRSGYKALVEIGGRDRDSFPGAVRRQRWWRGLSMRVPVRREWQEVASLAG